MFKIDKQNMIVSPLEKTDFQFFPLHTLEGHIPDLSSPSDHKDKMILQDDRGFLKVASLLKAYGQISQSQDQESDVLLKEGDMIEKVEHLLDDLSDIENSHSYLRELSHVVQLRDWQTGEEASFDILTFGIIFLLVEIIKGGEGAHFDSEGKRWVWLNHSKIGSRFKHYCGNFSFPLLTFLEMLMEDELIAEKKDRGRKYFTSCLPSIF